MMSEFKKWPKATQWVYSWAQLCIFHIKTPYSSHHIKATSVVHTVCCYLCNHLYSKKRDTNFAHHFQNLKHLLRESPKFIAQDYDLLIFSTSLFSKNKQKLLNSVLKLNRILKSNLYSFPLNTDFKNHNSVQFGWHSSWNINT